MAVHVSCRAQAGDTGMAEGIQSSHLTLGEETILARLREIDPARMANTNPSLAAAQRIADRIAKAIGSWRFILFQTIFFGAWIVANVVAVLSSWDPYPFVLLDLLLSFQAAYTAPIIMMSQNRQAAMDRYRAESDYEINLHAALELKLLQQKLNAIHERDIVEIRRTLKRIEERLGPDTGVFVRPRSTVRKRNIRF
jgi:uncharacterized membrane protein